MNRFVMLATFALGASACAFHTKPHVMYSDGAHPLSDTSVLATTGLTGGMEVRILNVDGKDTSCWQVGCPIWVRVLPGDHRFIVRVNDGGLGTRRQGDAELVLAEMKARHVYEVQVQIAGRAFRLSARDLGENPEYGITAGSHGYNRVAFE